MVEPVSLNQYRDDQLWAVIASIGRTTRVAAVFTSRLKALADGIVLPEDVRRALTELSRDLGVELKLA